MEIDLAMAQALGFQKLKYAFVERERRWLCRDVPLDRVLYAEAITDLHVAGTRHRHGPADVREAGLGPDLGDVSEP